jgi:mRNA interferase HigB
MNVIAKPNVMKAAEKFGVTGELGVWYRDARKSEWKSLLDVRASFPSADKVGDFLVFNIGHNSYRLIVRVDFQKNVMFFKWLITHKEYDRGEWKTWK